MRYRYIYILTALRLIIAGSHHRAPYKDAESRIARTAMRDR